MCSLKVLPLPVEEIARRVLAGDGLALARFGDGNFFCLRGDQGANCDGVVYTEAAANAQRWALKQPGVTACITSLARRQADADAVLEREGMDVAWHDGDAMQAASDAGALWPLVDALRQRTVVMVGPAHLRRFQGVPVSGFVETHPTRAFEQVEHLAFRLEKVVTETGAQVVLVSAGFGAAPTLVARFAGSGLTVIDAGSLWDMYVGVLSRSGSKRMGKARILELGVLNFRREVASWWPD